MTESNEKAPVALGLDDQSDESIPIVDDIAEVIERIELRGVRTYGLSVRRRDGGYADIPTEVDPAVLQTVDVETGQAQINKEMALQVQEDENRASVRIRFEHETEELVIEVDMAVMYTKNSQFAMGPSAKPEFVQNLALMNLWPFIRQHIADLSQRADAATYLGLIRQGQGQLIMKDDAP